MQGKKKLDQYHEKEAVPMKALVSIIAAMVFVLMAHAAGATHNSQDSEADQKPKQEKTRFTKHFNETLFQISERGEFGVEILLDDKEYPKLGKNVKGLVIHDKHHEDVEGADLKIVLLDSQGQDITGPLVVKEKGDGLYTVQNLDISKDSKGELRIRVRKKGIEDTAVFALPAAMKEHFPAGKYTE
jgi:hypothetical protein